MRIFILLLSIGFAAKSAAQSTSDSISVTQLLIDDYKTLENYNIQKHIENCTSDYILIEDGDIQTLSDEVAHFKKNANRVFTRTDSFQFYKVKIFENTAYLVYRLKSEIREQEKLKTFIWAESAICRREKNKWKIALINSTPIKK